MEKVNLCIITPAFNEEKNIERTILSVLSQKILPDLWIIVDDESKDNTASIIKKYELEHSFIKYLKRVRQNNKTYYANNVYAIIEGYQFLLNSGVEFDFLAFLDADIELPESYYEKIISFFKSDSDLGIASGHNLDRVSNNKLQMNIYDWRSLPKNIMVFRKECYQDIGGFLPLKYAGEDTCACFMARKKGWKTWATTNLMVIHNKPMGTAFQKNVLKVKFDQGVAEYYLGYHPIFVFMKSVKRGLLEKPFVIGGLSRLLGFAIASIHHDERQISDDLIKYIRKEQKERILHQEKKYKNYFIE